MKVSIMTHIEKFDYDTIVIPFYEGKKHPENRELSFFEPLLQNIPDSSFNGKSDQIMNFPYLIEGHMKNIVLTGCGEFDKFSDDSLRSSISKTVKFLNKIGAKTVILYPFSEKNSQLRITVESLYLTSYKFDKYKSVKKESSEVKKIDIPVVKYPENFNLYEIEGVVNSVFEARELVNEPSNIMTPKLLAETAVELGKKYGFEVEIFEHEKVKSLGMNAFLAVGAASKNRPYLIVMRYHNNKSDKILGLVGKGLTYDSGGLSIKPTDSMLTMKSDMAGGAAVMGTFCAAASQKLNINITGIVAACENSISGSAYRPGDILTTMSGKTVEVMNTDAEGRLTLADAVTYGIKHEKISSVVDIATLTGAAIVALGESITAVLSNSDSLYSKIEESAKIAGEKIWRLPVVEEYKELIKSDIADLKNTGGRHAGTITAAMFIQEFVENLEWVHLDIAGPSWNDKESALCIKGGTGEGVRTLYNLCKKMAD